MFVQALEISALKAHLSTRISIRWTFWTHKIEVYQGAFTGTFKSPCVYSKLIKSVHCEKSVCVCMCVCAQGGTLESSTYLW